MTIMPVTPSGRILPPDKLLTLWPHKTHIFQLYNILAVWIAGTKGLRKPLTWSNFSTNKANIYDKANCVTFPEWHVKVRPVRGQNFQLLHYAKQLVKKVNDSMKHPPTPIGMYRVDQSGGESVSSYQLFSPLPLPTNTIPIYFTHLNQFIADLNARF